MESFTNLDPVTIEMVFSDDTWACSIPMPRYVAEYACAGFGFGEPWYTGQIVVWALIVPWSQPQ